MPRLDVIDFRFACASILFLTVFAIAFPSAQAYQQPWQRFNTFDYLDRREPLSWPQMAAILDAPPKEFQIDDRYDDRFSKINFAVLLLLAKNDHRNSGLKNYNNNKVAHNRYEDRDEDYAAAGAGGGGDAERKKNRTVVVRTHQRNDHFTLFVRQNFAEVQQSCEAIIEHYALLDLTREQIHFVTLRAADDMDFVRYARRRFADDRDRSQFEQWIGEKRPLMLLWITRRFDPYRNKRQRNEDESHTKDNDEEDDADASDGMIEIRLMHNVDNPNSYLMTHWIEKMSRLPLLRHIRLINSTLPNVAISAFNTALVLMCFACFLLGYRRSLLHVRLIATIPIFLFIAGHLYNQINGSAADIDEARAWLGIAFSARFDGQSIGECFVLFTLYHTFAYAFYLFTNVCHEEIASLDEDQVCGDDFDHNEDGDHLAGGDDDNDCGTLMWLWNCATSNTTDKTQSLKNSTRRSIQPQPQPQCVRGKLHPKYKQQQKQPPPPQRNNKNKKFSQQSKQQKQQLVQAVIERHPQQPQKLASSSSSSSAKRQMICSSIFGFNRRMTATSALIIAFVSFVMIYNCYLLKY